MSHETVRGLILPDIVELISKRLQISELEALDKFYTSATGESFSDDETGLYGQSANFIYGLFCQEQDISWEI